ncbi:TMhelix containing protein [Vibrio phage 1.081.O._10N.286.52.C2]|nr:TMhelix containing protein [Vibrio phage 1.081.O._10N.286.52.C2]
MHELIMYFFILCGAAILLIFFHGVWPKHCSHDWIVVTDETTKSQCEHYASITGKTPSPKNPHQLREITARKRIVILKCNKCGKLNKTITEI